MDYTILIDEEVRAFIDKTNASYPPDAVRLTIQQQREVYDRMCASFRVDYPIGVTAVDTAIAGQQSMEYTGHSIPIRSYTPPNSTPKAQIIYYHGGGFVVGGLESHDDTCAEICGRSGLPLTAVDYRLAPEHTHPAAFEDALAAFLHIATHSDLPIILIGDSAGGTLAAAVAHAVRGQGVTPVGQVLIYPALGGDTSKGSYVEHAEAPMLTTKDMHFYHHIVSGGANTSADPRITPLTDVNFSDLPPTTIITAQCDPLSDDGRDYRERILAAGGKAGWYNETGLVHGYLRARHCAVRAAKSFTRIVEVTKHYAASC